MVDGTNQRMRYVGLRSRPARYGWLKFAKKDPSTQYSNACFDFERRLGTAVSSIIKIQDVSLDSSSHVVSVENNALDLPRKEFMVLKILMEQAGRIQSREQLESKLYEWGEEVASNAIEVHIHHLRKKLPEGFIKTIRGVGYSVAKGS
jgi:DNA-binding response OmpR family regulator